MKKLLLFLLFTTLVKAQIINFPDANFKARLLNAAPNNYIASTQTPDSNGSVTSYNSIDINGDGEIQVSEALQIKYLNVTAIVSDNLQGITEFANLQYLNCSQLGLYLFNLDLTGMSNLIFLNCRLNQLNNLNLTGLTALKNLNCSNNTLFSLNLSGLSNLTDLNCSTNQITSLSVSNLLNLKFFYCSYNNLSSIDVSGLSNLKVFECNNNYNYLTSISLNGLLNLECLNCSNNNLQNINVGDLVKLTEFRCSQNQLSSLDITTLSKLTVLAASYNQLTFLVIKNNNTVWNSLDFGNNPNLAYICPNDKDLNLVQQLVTYYGYSNVQVNSYCSFNPGGVYYTIQGNNKLDSNNNGCNAADPIYPNLKFNITNGTITGSLISNSTGNYSIPVSAGTHTITPQFENPTYFNASPTSATATFPTTTSPYTRNFCITPNGVHHDLEIVVIPIIRARPGFDATYKIKYKNKGNLNENATVSFNYNEPILDFVSSSVAPTTQSNGILSWNIGLLTPFQSGEIEVTLNLNSSTETPAVVAGNILSFIAAITGLNTDETPVDNTFALSQVVVNSFDPNDKTCLEGEALNATTIGKYVHYKIKFENTGTFPAQNIVVKDMIDTTKFDISTLQMTDASHSCTTRISDTNKVEFIFENINLPFDDANNDGYVVFKIKTKPTLVVGSTISNSANIYFDYNFPIVTNTATSTFQTLVNNSYTLDNNIGISPIPTKDTLTISIQNSEKINSISIYNMLGQVVQTIIGSSNTINVSELKAGDYIIKITTEKGTISKKIIKE